MNRAIVAVVCLCILTTFQPAPPTLQAVVDGPPLRIVLLGDSYTAGNGAKGPSGEIEYYGPDGCYRHHQNWGERYADALFGQGFNVSVVNRACAGARIEEVAEQAQLKEGPVPEVELVQGEWEASDPELMAILLERDPCGVPQYPDEEYWTFEVESAQYDAWTDHTLVDLTCKRYIEPQISGAIGPETDLVVMTIGGNNADFADLVVDCFAPFVGSGSECESRIDVARQLVPTIAEQVTDLLVRLRTDLRPDAKVILVDYPYLALNDGFSRDEYPVADEIRALGDEATVAAQNAVLTANAEVGADFAIFVDGVKTHYNGHEPSGEWPAYNPDRWIWEIPEGLAPLYLDRNEFYHPNPTGHQEYAALLAASSSFGVSAGGQYAVLAWPGGPYVTKVGAALTLDATGSYSTNGPITTYEWDIDGDGSYDIVTPDRTYSYTYAAPFDGVISLRVTDGFGSQDVATALAAATEDGDEILVTLDNCPDDANHGQADFDGDGIGDVCDLDPGFIPTPVERVSVDSGGTQGNLDSGGGRLGMDARAVAFGSAASNLVDADTNGDPDIFVRDRAAGTTARVSVASDGSEANGGSYYASMSADGRFVAFDSEATNLVAGDSNDSYDVFVHDRVAGTTTRVSVASDGSQVDGDSRFPSISGDGRYVAFVSLATRLVKGDRNREQDVFVHDTQTGETTRVSVASNGAEANDVNLWTQPAISGDGRFVGFTSWASNLVTGDTNDTWDAFVRDRQAGTTSRVSVGADGAQANADSYISDLSPDGQFAVFSSRAGNLVAGDSNGAVDIFIRDRQAATTTRVSVAFDGSQANGGSGSAGISGDGRFVVFQSNASNLVVGDTNATRDIFVHDRQAQSTCRVSVAYDGTQAEGDGTVVSNYPAISSDGRFVAFNSYAANLVPNDTNGVPDQFLRPNAPCQ